MSHSLERYPKQTARFMFLSAVNCQRLEKTANDYLGSSRTLHRRAVDRRAGANAPTRWHTCPHRFHLAAVTERRRARHLNEAIAGDELVTCLSKDRNVVVKAIRASGLVRTASELHEATPVAAAALGRSLLAALLLASGKKDLETVQMEFRGDGPLRAVVAIADGRGHVRGYVGDPQVQLPPTAAGKLDVGRAVGRGFLAVVRNHSTWSEPYRGITEIQTGEIGDDVLHYLVRSEQIPSALALGVFVQGGHVQAAGGYLVQLLPESTPETLDRVEENVLQLNKRGTPTQLIRDGMDAMDIVQQLMVDIDETSLRRVQPQYSCSCDASRVRRMVALLPRDEIESILREQNRLEAKCEFCGSYYELSSDETRALLRDA
jgi:molecular chaperone Hsp33